MREKGERKRAHFSSNFPGKSARNVDPDREKVAKPDIKVSPQTSLTLYALRSRFRPYSIFRQIFFLQIRLIFSPILVIFFFSSSIDREKLGCLCGDADGKRDSESEWDRDLQWAFLRLRFQSRRSDGLQRPVSDQFGVIFFLFSFRGGASGFFAVAAFSSFSRRRLHRAPRLEIGHPRRRRHQIRCRGIRLNVWRIWIDLINKIGHVKEMCFY